MRTIIELEVGKKIGLHELQESLDAWLNSNENLSVSVTPHLDSDYEHIQLVIERSIKTEE